MPLIEIATIESPDRVAAVDRWRLGTTAIAIALVAVLSKAMGFAEKLVVAHYFGTTPAADIYFAMTGTLFSAVFLAKELVYPTLLPTLSQATSLSPQVFSELFARAFRWTVLLVLVVAAVGAIWMPYATRLLLPGFDNSQNAKLAHLLRCLLPGGMLMVMMAVTYTALNASGRLVVASLAEAVFKAVLLAGAILLIPAGGLGAIPTAMIAGSAACLCIHLVVLRPRGVTNFRPSPSSGKLLGRTAVLMGPIIIGVVFSHVSDIVDNLIASSLPRGQLSYLSYAKKLTDAILLIGPTAMTTVVYARASRLASLSRHDEMAELLGKGLRLLLFLGVPIACLMIAFRWAIVKVLFQHGSFGPESTAGVAGALTVYGLGLVTLSIEGLCIYSFYSLSDTRTPVAAGVLCVLLDIVLAIVLARTIGYMGIAAALVIAKSIKVVALLLMLHRKLGKSMIRDRWSAFTARLIIAAGLTSLTMWFMASHWGAVRAGSIISLSGAILIAGLVYVGLSLLIGMKEPGLLMAAVPWKRLVGHRQSNDR